MTWRSSVDGGVRRHEPEQPRAIPAPSHGRSVRAVLLRFADWLAGYGDVSQDQYDLWATRLGRRAKRLYYRRPRPGTLAVAPFVLVDAAVPAARALVRRRAAFPI